MYNGQEFPQGAQLRIYNGLALQSAARSQSEQVTPGSTTMPVNNCQDLRRGHGIGLGVLAPTLDLAKLCRKCSARSSLFCAVQKTSAKLASKHTPPKHTPRAKIINATYVTRPPLLPLPKLCVRVYGFFCSGGSSCGHFHAVANTSCSPGPSSYTGEKRK